MSRANTLPMMLLVAAAFVVTGAVPFDMTPATPEATESAASSVLPVSVIRPPRITLRNHTDNRQPVEVLDWVVGRYESLGLQLPDVEVRFYAYEPSLAECSGHGGLWTAAGPDTHRVDICAIGERSRRRTLIHEFAHVWTNSNLVGARRAAFLALRGLEAWNDPTVEWELRGTEQASVILTWGFDVVCAPSDMVVGESFDALSEAFRFITGTDPVCRQS